MRANAVHETGETGKTREGQEGEPGELGAKVNRLEIPFLSCQYLVSFLSGSWIKIKNPCGEKKKKKE